MHDLAEVMEKSEEIKDLKEKLVECFKAELSMKSMDCIDTKEAGEVVDMIKDLAETEKYCMEALYYQKVTEAMTSYEEPRYGYNANRYSSGRYAPKGMGSTSMGFLPHTPYLKYDGEMTGADYMQESMMGYDPNRSTDRMNRNMGYRSMEGEDPRYGRAYNEYKTMRRHYTESKSQNDKHEMDVHAQEHVQDTIATIRDIWGDADPMLKKRMKEDFTKLVNEMTV